MARLRLATHVLFISTPSKVRHRATFEPEPRVRVVTPHLLLPRRAGGLALAAAEIRTRFLRDVDVVWINDPVLGAPCLHKGVPAVYDVTDDWREARLPAPDRKRLVAAEDALARKVTTIVCSEVLRDRWSARYGVIPTVIHNGVDVAAHANARPRDLPGPGPHAVYVGTLHRERLDLDLLTTLAASRGVTIHLVGPDHLDDASRRLLEQAERINLHGAVPYSDTPRWMASADVLICPHRVDSFTLSLDAIKSFEYLASDRPVVATPTSGFQSLVGQEGVAVVEPALFVETTVAVGQAPRRAFKRRAEGHDWSARAYEFASILSGAAATIA